MVTLKEQDSPVDVVAVTVVVPSEKNEPEALLYVTVPQVVPVVPASG